MSGSFGPKVNSDLPLNSWFDESTRMGHIGYMSAMAKSRIDPELKRQAAVKRRAISFPVQTDSPEDEVLSPAARRNKLADEF